ncbi:MAG: NADH-quinone oxidoreductase subunit NuoB [Oligoflexia bacterium]|nr:NADH-quinone oxidoreductase subunit NuoB [Oligoflexia bacterium]
MSGSFGFSTLQKALSWARSKSLWQISTGAGCCADEVLNAIGARYDLERFGSVAQVDARQSDLLIVNGAISLKAAPYLRALYNEMLEPKYVLAIGSCANGGGLFGPKYSYATTAGANEVVPVDVYVPGCPPRPEAIMNGLIYLQEKIRRGREHNSNEA